MQMLLFDILDKSYFIRLSILPFYYEFFFCYFDFYLFHNSISLLLF